MGLATLLDDKYVGAKQSRIELQNDPGVRQLARWMTREGPEWRWDLYEAVLKPRAHRGGPVYAAPNPVGERWIEAARNRVVQGGAPASSVFLEGLVNLDSELEDVAWASVFSELEDAAGDEGWTRAAPEGLVLCRSCDHWSLRPWDAASDAKACPACSGDTFRILPFTLAPETKRAIQNGVAFELATAEGFRAAGGTVYSNNSRELGTHQVGVRFRDPSGGLECDLIGRIQDTVFYVECKDPGPDGTVETTDIEVATGRAERLLEPLDSPSGPSDIAQVAVLVVTTGEVHGSVDVEGLRHGELSQSGIPVHAVEKDGLLKLDERLQGITRKLRSEA